MGVIWQPVCTIFVLYWDTRLYL